MVGFLRQLEILVMLYFHPSLQSVVASPQYPQFLAEAIRVFCKILEEGDAQFIAEQNMQVSGILYTDDLIKLTV